MAPRVSWSSILPGLIALTAVLLIAAGILMFGGVGRIRGATIRLFVATNQARGVMRGTEVWIAGQKVGQVKDIAFRPPSTDTASRLLIETRVRKRDANQIRRDSRAEIRTGLRMIGPSVVYVSGGTSASPAIEDGDTLYGMQDGAELRRAKVKAAIALLKPSVADARASFARLRDTTGTVGAARSRGFADKMRRLRASFSRARGSFDGEGQTETARAIVTRARATLARVDSIRAMLASSAGSVGRFRRDTSLMANVSDVRAELARVRDALGAADGNTSRFKTDSALTRSLADANDEMTLLLADMKRHPLRYLHF
ncbi:MAG TPA: MlaD family protein [Gemmatimonadaceae bacterium]|nr:MlaD family protein [Gemmatimonadaceae bacterium]